MNYLQRPWYALLLDHLQQPLETPTWPEVSTSTQSPTWHSMCSPVEPWPLTFRKPKMQPELTWKRRIL